MTTTAEAAILASMIRRIEALERAVSRPPVTSTSAALASITSSVNAHGKVIGQVIYNTDTDRPVWASGTTAGSVWVDATGATAHTPV